MEMQKEFKLSPLGEVGQGLFARMMKTLESARLLKKSALSGSQLNPLPADDLVRPSTHNKVTIQIHHDDWP